MDDDLIKFYNIGISTQKLHHFVHFVMS